MKISVSKISTKGMTLIETLIGISIAIGLLAATLYVGTELHRKSSWKEDALALHSTGMQILQSLEERVLNAGNGFGSGLLIMAGEQHRYAIEVYPCRNECVAAQNYGPYRNMLSDKRSDEIQILRVSPNYARNILYEMKDAQNSISKYATGATPNNVATEFIWEPNWIYAIKERNNSWGCALRLSIETENNQNIISCTDYNNSNFCRCIALQPPTRPMGQLWSRNMFRDWLVGPLDGFSARIKFTNQIPRLEITDSFVDVGSVDGTTLGSAWWTDRTKASRAVLSLNAQLGIPDPANPNQLLWFPDASRNHPYISLCTRSGFYTAELARCSEIVQNVFGGLDPDLDIEGVQNALMRRVRAVRLILVVQSPRVDAQKISWDGSAFEVNADGTFQNGKLTRRFEKIIWPPNLQQSFEKGNIPEEGSGIGGVLFPLNP